MALVLVNTAGATNANTYASLAEAETVMESVFHKDAWSSAATDNKNIVLVEATRLLDEHYDWEGIKYTADQSLRWPRYSVLDPDGEDVDYESIPDFLKTATALLALSILSEDVTTELDTDGFTKLKVGSIELEANVNYRKNTVPDNVHQIVKFYGTRLQNSGFATVLRT